MRAMTSTVLVSLVAALPANAQLSEHRFVERLEPFIDKSMREEKIPGLAVGIVAEGRPVYVRGFGITDSRDPGRPVTD